MCRDLKNGKDAPDLGQSLGLWALPLSCPWPSRGSVRPHPTHSQEARRKLGSCSGLRLSQGSLPSQSASGLQVPAHAEAGGQAASSGAVGIGAERSSLQVGITGPQHLSLLRGLTTKHPFPHASQASQVSGPGGQGAWRACAPGHHQRRISFHLCKDSLTPEHINILNDSERNWDSRRPAPPLPLLPLPSPLTLPPPFCPPLTPLPSFLFHSCLSLCLPSCPHFSPSPPFSFSPLLSLSPPRTPQLLTFTPQLRGGGPAGPAPLSVCPSPAGPRSLPEPGGRAHTVGPRERRLSTATTAPEAHAQAFAVCPEAHGLPWPMPC